MPELSDQEIADSLARQAVSIPALYVVETEHGFATLPGEGGIAGLKLVWRLTALDPKEGIVVHLPLLFDFDFAVEVGIASEEKAQELKAKADAYVAEQTPTTEPGGSNNG
jgi:hypothetical protein